MKPLTLAVALLLAGCYTKEGVQYVIVPQPVAGVMGIIQFAREYQRAPNRWDARRAPEADIHLR